MYELLYTSLAADSVREKELSGILHMSEKNNHIDRITGMLIFTGKEFLQLLEGEKDKVQQCYERIKKDKRHTHLQIFHEGEITQRSFDQWSMDVRSMPIRQVLTSLSEKQPSQGLGVKPGAGRKLFEVLRDYL